MSNTLAFDLSTQGLKAIIIDDKLKILQEEVIQFDKDIPEHKTDGGVHKYEKSLEVTSPVLMWVQSLDLLLEKIKKNGCDLGQIACLSGTAQQHGSVYWKRGSENTLKSLSEHDTMKDGLKNCFAIENSPVWMDSSTTKYCRLLEDTVGGPAKLSAISGSSAFERFTGNQIAKIYQEHRSLYDECDRISLVSSFVASLFIGSYAPIDLSDGSGMNLLNIKTNQWEQILLNACADNLDERLGSPVPSFSILGSISQYMIKRYGFNKDCQIAAFTGDNPASLAGMRLLQGNVAISLGTSDTIMLALKSPESSANIGHVFVSPTDENGYMALLCYKNGSLTREQIKHQTGYKSWEDFNQALLTTSPGNNGNLGIYFIDQEILPFSHGIYRWNKQNEIMNEFQPNVEARALIEGQIIAKRIHAEKIGFTHSPETQILATGGASTNKEILQIIANIFNAPVYILQETSNSACLGSAYRARHALMNNKIKITFEESLKIVSNESPYCMVSEPQKNTFNIYNEMCTRYNELENCIVKMKTM